MVFNKARSRSLRVGVSMLAVAAVGATLPAQAQSASAGQVDSSTGATDSTGDQEIVITGRRAALEAASERKKNSETIIDSVVADDAGKLPDNSITEVLQRVSGVSIVRFAALGDPDHFSVQGSGIQVRGLTGVASRLNGRDIFSASNGRALLWSDVTPELMKAVDVYKASTADLIEGGTGGQIDLRTKMPFDFDGKFHVAATGELSVGDMANQIDPMGSVLVTKSFDTPIGKIGLLADVAYSQFSSLSQFIRVEPYFRTRIGATDRYIPGGFTYGDEAFRYRRYGIYGAVQWRPADDITLTGAFFQSRYKNQSSDYGALVSSQSLAVDPSSSSFDSNGLLLKTTSLFNRNTGTFQPSPDQVTSNGNKGFVTGNSVTRDYSFSFDWSPSDSPLALRGSFQRVDSSRIYDRLDIFREVGFGQSFGMDLTGDLPRITVTPATQASFANPANYNWTASMPHNEDNSGRLDAGQLDAEYKFDNSFFRSVKVGARYAKRTERDFANGYRWSPLGRGWNGDPQLTYANAAPGDVGYHVFEDFFRGNTSLPGNLLFATESLAKRFHTDRRGLTQSPPAGFCPGGNCANAGPLPRSTYGGNAGSGFILPDDRIDNKTVNLAGYALARFGSGEGGQGAFSGNVGVRVVNLRNEGSGFITQNSNTFIRNGQRFELGRRAIPRGGKTDFTRVLPSINLEFAASETIKLRGSYNITMDLPSFDALRASGEINVATTSNPVPNSPGIFTSFTTATGNPLLRPTMSNNFDLSLEYYGTGGKTFHIAPFYKRLTDLPVFAISSRALTVVYADGTRENIQAVATDFVNAPKAANVKGVEAGGRIFLDMLDGWASGFGFEGNYTFIDSSDPGNTYRDINGVIRNDVPVIGLSRHNFNAALLYERNPISLRIAYSWRSRYLMNTKSNGTDPNYPYFSAPGVVTDQDGVGNAGANTLIALPVYGGTYGTLDAGVRFKVTENFSFGIQGSNLNAATQRTLMGGYPGGELKGRSWFQSDRRISTGINLAF